MSLGKQWERFDLPIDDARTHPSLQNRVDGLNMANLNKIRRTVAAGGDAREAIRVARVGKALYVVDGFHRREAYLREGRTTIPALIAKMSLQEAQEYARTANVANGKPLNRIDKDALWKAHLEQGRHLDSNGTPLPSRVIAADLGHIWSHETIRKKLKASGFEVSTAVEFPDGYKPYGPTAEELAEERLADAELAVGDLGALLPTLEEDDRKRLLATAKAVLDAIEKGDDRARDKTLQLLRNPLDI